jgi:cytochrome c-type biogenesis protein CcmE
MVEMEQDGIMTDNGPKLSRGRSRRKMRWAALLALLLGVGVFLAYAAGRLGKSIIYYWGPSELRAAGRKAMGASIRLGGRVRPGSVARLNDGALCFDLSDGKTTFPVRTRVVPPQMFREGIGVVVEGTLGRDGVFEGSRLLVSHGNEYRAPHEGENVDMRRLIESAEKLDESRRERTP